MSTGALVPDRTDRLPILALLGANIVSLVGNMLSMIALPWFVLETTGSPAMTGLVGFAVVLPGFASGIFGGTLVDQFGFKRVSVVADVVSGLAIAAIPLLYHTVGLAFWQLLALVFLGTILDIPGLSARRAMIPELAERAGLRLERVNASFESLSHLALLIGPLLAGLLIVRFGASNVFWLDAATFAVSATMVATLIPRPPAPDSPEERGSYVEELLTGLRFIRRDRLLFPMAIVVGLSNGLSSSLFALILPVYALERFGDATDLGLMVTAAGAGALVGATLYGSFGHRWPRRALWYASFLALPFVYWTLSWSPPLLFLLAVLAVTELANGPINPLMVTIRHERSPTALRGRVFSTFAAIALAAQPIGIVATGFLIEGIGFQPTVLVFAACLQILGLAILFVPAFRHMERHATPPAGGEEPVNVPG